MPRPSRPSSPAYVFPARRLGHVLLLLVTFTTALGLYYLWQEHLLRQEATFKRYPDFNTYIPEGYLIHGIDVSRYQRSVNWKKVAQMKVADVKIGFAFVKATEGVFSVDPAFRRNWRALSQTSIRKGAYHFYRPQASGEQQAIHFMKTVPLQRGDLPAVIDVEVAPATPAAKAAFRKELLSCLQLVESATGTRPIIYSNVHFYEKWLGPSFDKYPLWAAHYFQRKRPRIEREWHFWQHSEQATIDGIASKVDMNVFAGDSLDFHKMLIR